MERVSILVVEDDPDLREAVMVALETHGYRPLAASDGRHALELLRGGARPRLILLDLMMPRMDGWQFRAEQMADAAIAHIPVVVLSAAAPQRVTRLAVEDVLHKPIDLDTLLAAVRRHC
jgi:CheY-like chemotaxis protein